LSPTSCGSTLSRSPDLNLPAPPAARQGAAVVGGISSAPAPGGGLAQGGCTWDPAVFRPDRKPGDQKPGYPATEGFNFSDENFRIPPALVPGTGFTKPDCGTWIRKLRSGDQVKDIYHSCDRLSCPRCSDTAITMKAHEAEERFTHYEKAKLQEGAVLIPGEIRRSSPRHIPFTMSPAHFAELWYLGGETHAGFLRLARKELNEFMKKCGLVGGCEVYHPNRVRHPDTGLTGRKAKELIIKEAMLAGAMKDDSPSWMMYAYIRSRRNWQDYYYFSPHFHFVGYGTLPDKETFEAAFPGWSYHNKGTVAGPGGLLRYLFSHQGMIDGCYAVTWHGRLSTVSLGREELRTVEKPVLCTETGLPWIIIESAILDEVGRTYTETVTEYRVFFRTHLEHGPPDPFRVRTGKAGPRSSCPDWVREKGIVAMAAYCDEHGRL